MKLRNRLRRLTHPARKLAFHDGAYRNLAASSHLRQGGNLLGFAFGELGIGQHLRGVAAAFEVAGINFSITNYERTLHRQEDATLAHRIDPASPHQTNVFCLNSDSILDLFDRQRDLFSERYNIGYGFWELSDFPEPWLPVMNVLDEIWAPSQHVQQVMAEKASVPVLHMPMAVDFEPPPASSREALGLPADRFVFLFTFDFSSRLERKNPAAVIAAFRHAFTENDERAVLVLKTKTIESVEQQVEERRILRRAIADDPRILLIDETWEYSKVLTLMRAADAYVSLHRAEGFGLGMAEAMKLGKPVIATAYSGNEDFTRPETALRVGYQLVPVPPGGYYDLEGDSVWAEPDVDEAAEHMRRLVAEPELARDLGRRGQSFIDEHHSHAAVGARYAKRLRRIGLL